MRILHAIHDFGPRHLAGAELYVERLAREQARRPGVEVVILCAEYDPSAPHGAVRRRDHAGLPVVEVVNNWRFETLDESAASPVMDRILARVLDEPPGPPDLVHVHSLTGLSLGLPALARARGIPCVATLHDYSLFCAAGGQLLRHGEPGGRERCQELDPSRCARCVSASPLGRLLTLGRVTRGAGGLNRAARLARLVRRLTPAGFGAAERAVGRLGRGRVSPQQVQRRLSCAEAAFESLDLVVSPSRTLARTFVRLGVPGAGRIQVSDYGFPALDPAPGQLPPGGPLRVGFVGSLVEHKGAHLLLQAADLLGPETVQVSLFGDEQVSPGYSASLRAMARGGAVRFMGPFSPRDAAQVYAQLHCLVVPSIWPENSPLVIHEAFQAGVPVIASDQGGCAELVREGAGGLLFESGDPEDLARQLARLARQPSLGARLASEAPEVKGIAQDADEWFERYEAAGLEPGAARPRSAGVDVSVLLLTRDGGRTLPALIQALDRQQTALEVQRVAVDSGSSDDTVPLLRRAGFTVHQVPPEQFHHGRTRNHGIARCQGELVVLLAQDATPVGARWLDALTAPLLADDRLAGSFARQVPRRDADPFVRFYAARHHTAGRRPRTTFVRDRELRAVGPWRRMELCAFDNVCSCIRRIAWEQIPLPEAPFAEDLAWAQEVLLAGHGLTFAADAVVEHSHNRPAGYELRRAYQAHRQLRRLFGLRTVPSALHLHAAVAGTLGSHLATLARSPGPRRRRHLPRALALGVALPLGQYLGGLAADTGLDLLGTEGV